LQGARLCDFARRMAARDFWRRRTAVPHAVGRLPFRQLRHSLVSFQRRTDRARMRAAHAGPGAQHPRAGGQRLNTPARGASASLQRCEKYREGRMSGLKTVLGFAVGFALGAAMLPGNAVQAQSNYPNRPIRIIVPYPAGGIVDIVARAVTEQVGRDWKKTVVVEARPGGNSNIGTASVARSEPDGYTWLARRCR